MTVANKQRKVKERLLMIYVKRNFRLTLTLSMGALILVLVASSAGGFCYFSSKRSMSLAAKESPVDVVFTQDTYELMGSQQPPSPHEFLQVIYAEPDVVDAYGLAAIVLDMNVTINRQNRGIHRVLIISANKKEGGLNVTLSQGSQIQDSTRILLSEDFFEKFNVTLDDQVGLLKVISKIPLKMRGISGPVAGVTPKRFSQLTVDLGLHDSLVLAGYTEAELLSFDEYPFVLANMSRFEIQYLLDYAAKHRSLPSILATFFAKFNDEIYLNPWDTDITVFNLQELAQDLRQDMNNLTSTRFGYEYAVISIRAVPAANVFQELSQFINISKLTVIAFGATVAFVGWYFYSSLSKITLLAKTRELQLMRIRGIPQKSITRSISLLVIASGVIGTIAGLLLGFLLTLNVSPSVLSVSITETDIMRTFGVSSLLFYAFFGLAASMISQRQALSKVKTIMPTAEEVGIEDKSKMGLMEKVVLVVAVSLGSAKVVGWLLGINLISWSQTANPITSALMLFARLIDQTILDALGALLLIYALVTILSRYPEILSTISRWICRVLSPRLSLLSKKLMSVKSARMAGIMVVASLLIFNTVSTNMGYRGVEVAWKSLSTTIVGADIRIDMPEEASLPVIELLSTLSEVDNYTQVLTISCGIGSPLGSCVVYAIDPERYATVLRVAGGGLESIKAGEVLVSDFFREMGLLRVGDTVTLKGEKSLSVRGFIKSTPGLLSIPAVKRFAVISIESVEDLAYIIISRTLLLKVNSMRPDAVLGNLMSRLPENVRLKLSTATESQMATKFGGRIAAPLIVKSVMSMLLIASLIGVVFAALALGVMGYSEADERRRLDGLLRVKGVTRWQLLGIALSEVLCMLALSSVIGFFAGYAMASGYTSYFSAAFPINATPVPSYELATQLLVLLATYVIAFLAPAVYTMKKTAYLHIH